MKSDTKIRSFLDIVEKHAASVQLKLPVFPGAAFELHKLLSDEDAPMDRASQIISKDQTLASKVLKLANSAHYSGMNRGVRTISDAIMRLGNNHILNLVTCACQQGYYKSTNKTLAQYLRISWKHALCVSIGSKWLVQEIGYRKLGEEAFLAGLLHDLGKLLIIKVIEEMGSWDGIEITDLFISKALESMHAEQGFNLMERWSIPPVYCNIALNHHKEEFDEGDKLLMAIRVVNHVCRKAGVSTNPEKPEDLTTLPEVNALDIDANVLSDLELVMEEAVEAEYGRLGEAALEPSTPYGVYL